MSAVSQTSSSPIARATSRIAGPSQEPDVSADVVSLSGAKLPREADMAKLLAPLPQSVAQAVATRLRGYPDEAIKVLANLDLKFEKMPRSEWHSTGPDQTLGSPGEYVESRKAVRFANFAPLESPGQSRYVRFLEGSFAAAAGLAAALVPMGLGVATMLLGAVHGADSNAVVIAAAAGVPTAFAVVRAAASEFSRNEIAQIGKITKIDVFEHELAHALDHAVGQTPQVRELPPVAEKYLTYYDGKVLDKAAQEYSTLRSPELIGLFEACQEGKEGHAFTTGYAGSHPSEYFAESAKAYVKDETRPAPNRATLKTIDPAMYEFVDRFFQEKIKDLAAPLP